VFIFYIVTSNNLLSKIMHDVLPKYMDLGYSNKIFWTFSDKSIKYQMNKVKRKIDYSLFDPKKCEWNYDHEKYMKLLQSYSV